MDDIAVSKSRPYMAYSAVGLVGLSVGLGLGYLWGKRNGDVFVLPADVKGEGESEVEGWTVVRDLPTGDFRLSPEEVKIGVEIVDEIITQEGYTHRNVFNGSVDTWDQELEMQNRSPDAPYILHVDEFMADEMSYMQSTVTYYKGDHVVSDERDQQIYNWEAMFGELRFGHGSNDSNICYVRNEKMECEWEILLHTGHYLLEVLGGELEDGYEEQDLKHSRDRRFRVSD